MTLHKIITHLRNNPLDYTDNPDGDDICFNNLDVNLSVYRRKSPKPNKIVFKFFNETSVLENPEIGVFTFNKAPADFNDVYDFVYELNNACNNNIACAFKANVEMQKRFNIFPQSPDELLSFIQNIKLDGTKFNESDELKSYVYNYDLDLRVPAIDEVLRFKADGINAHYLISGKERKGRILLLYDSHYTKEIFCDFNNDVIEAAADMYKKISPHLGMQVEALIPKIFIPKTEPVKIEKFVL